MCRQTVGFFFGVPMSFTTPPHRLAQLAIILSVPLWSGCGGGGDSELQQDFPRPTESSSKCPKAALSDVWLSSRLTCASTDQLLIRLSAGRNGTRSDTAYIVKQQAFDLGFRNVLGGEVGRHFKHLVCVRQAPADLDRLALATDLGQVLGTHNFSSRLPAGISTSTLTIAGTNQPGFTSMPCTAALHPLIVDYDTGRVVSINSGALAALSVYDR
jgi:hypothetical protein